MKRIYPVIIVVLAGIVLLFFARVRNQSNEKLKPTPQFPAEQTSALETQTNSEGPVTIGATPKLSSEIAFEISLDTHSGELNVDMTRAAALIDENGKEYKPISWEGNPPGGHHRKGMLSFGVIKPTPKTLQLTVRQVGSIAERKFLWTIQP